MEHKIFRIISLISILSIIGIVIGYNLASDYKVQLILKICPVSILIALSFFYILHYKFTYYSFLTSVSLFFCLLGDVFMSFYDPRLVGDMSEKIFYLIMGGACFLTGRIVLIFVFALNPTQTKRCFIDYVHLSGKKHFIVLISHICFSLPFIILGVLFLVYFQTQLSIFVLIYFVLGFGIQLSYAFLRINAISKESLAASIFGFVGMFCFNVADIFLLTTLLTNLFPNYTINISNCIYWLSMILLTISIVRHSKESNEKELELKALGYI